MKNEQKRRRTPEETWKALEDLAAEEDTRRIAALTDEELDAELAESGFDPAKVRAEGAVFAAALLDRRDREKEPEEKLQARRARLEARAARRGALSRDDLVKRIDALRADPRLGLAVGFRNRDTSAAGVRELEDMLDEMDELLESAGFGKGN
jgi:hypothetical protein